MLRSVSALAAFHLRARRRVNLVWLLCLTLAVSIFPRSYFDYYPEVSDRQVLVASMRSNKATRALYGTLEEPGTLGQVINWEMAMWVVLLGAVMAVLHYSASYRTWENDGRLELVRAGGMRRRTPIIAALVSSFVLTGALAVLTFLSLSVQVYFFDEFDWTGAAYFSWMVWLSTFGSVLLAGVFQLFAGGHSSPGRIGMSSLGLNYVVRAYADSAGTGNHGWLNWLSPLGWKSVIDPYNDNDWRKGLLLCGACVVVAALLVLVDGLRPFGASLVRERRHAESTEARAFRTVPGILWRVSRGQVWTWLVVVTAIEAFMVSLSASIKEMIESDDHAGQVFVDLLPEGDLITNFLIYMTTFTSILVAVAVVQLVLTHRRLEQAGIVEIVRSTGRPRHSPLLEELIVVFAAFILLLIGLFLGGAIGLSTHLGDLYDVLAKVTLSLFGPGAFFVGLAAALVGLWPRWSLWAWAPVVASAFVTAFGEIFSLPSWLVDYSPFSMTYTLENAHVAQAAVLSLLGLALAGVGVWGVRRREVTT